MKRIEYDHVKTLHGPVDCSNFKKLSAKGKTKASNNIPKDAFIIGFVLKSIEKVYQTSLMDSRNS